METLASLARLASQAFDARALVSALERTLKSPDAERRARFLCEGLARIAALAALAEANSPFASLYGETRLDGLHFAQFGTADLGSSEPALMDRALAA
jgi:putative acyl-CoA dehydrogenase